MRVTVRVTPRARSAGVEPLPNGSLRVKVAEPAEGGRANAAALTLVAAHFGVPQRSVRLIRGATHRQKVLEIGDSHR